MSFERIKYPDGQISAKWTSTEPLILRERINTYEDLIFVRSIAEVVHSLNRDVYSLFIPCLFGQRSDRRFATNQSFDLKIICEIINSCNFKHVEVFDPHSDVALALINNSMAVLPDRFVSDSLTHMNKRGINDSNIVLISPDAGAYKKVFRMGENFGYETIAAVKYRNSNGDIVSTHLTGEVSGKDCLIVDDICDGGATFIFLSAELRKRGAKSISLYVSHGYFSRGIQPLRESMDHIYCTNSVKDLPDMWQTIHGLENVSDFVTQFKII